MNFGFDIDGTISAAPEAFKWIMACLREGDHEVHVITGQVYEITAADYQFREKQLSDLGISSAYYSNLYIAGPPDWVATKAMYCKDNNIEFMFENDVSYAQAISVYCPTTVMWVHK